VETLGRRYPAQIVRVIDGDTVEVLADVGFYTGVRVHLRVRGVDCPETSTVEGRAARRFAVEVLPAGSPVVVTTYKVADHEAKTFDRYVADVVLPGGQDFGELLVARGYAVRVR
jgi:micrococcal nuclease